MNAVAPMLSPWIGLAWLPGLVALQSIPGTGALRTLFLLAGIVHLAVLARRGPTATWPRGRSEALWFALLTAWLLVQAGLLAPTPGGALSALAGEWGKLLLMAALGIALAAYARKDKAGPGWPVIGLFGGFFIHVLSTLGFQAWAWLRNGTPTFGESFLGNYGYASPFVTGALAFLLAEAVARLHRQRWLPVSNGLLLAMTLATLVAQAMLIAKASIIVAVILFLVAAAVAATPNLRYWRTLFLLGGVVTVAASLAISNRWQGGMGEMASAARTAPTDFRSLGGAAGDSAAPPVKSNGSFYERAVWAKIGLAGVAAHPLGLGYGSDAFGRYVAEQGGPKGAVSSHSGWIDFALANGIPGLVLLLALFAALMRRGWLAFRAGNPAGLAALLVTLNFFARSAIDGNLAGSRLTGFAFVAAALWALAAQPGAERDDRHAD